MARADRLVFLGSPSDFSTASLDPNDVIFTGFGPGYRLSPGADRTEIVAVPEPSSTALLGATVLSALGFPHAAPVAGPRRGR